MLLSLFVCCLFKCFGIVSYIIFSFFDRQISFDFGLMFEHIQPNELILKWPAMRGIPFAKYDIRINGNKHPITVKNDEAHDFLKFFKLIPTHRNAFDTSVNSFMTFSGVSQTFILIHSCFLINIYLQNPNSDPEQLKRDSTFGYTYLIVIASQDSSAMKFYIDLEDKLISVSCILTLFSRNLNFVKQSNVFGGGWWVVCTCTVNIWSTNVPRFIYIFPESIFK